MWFVYFVVEKSLHRRFRRDGRAFVREHFFQFGIVRLAGGEGFLVMPARELRERRRLAQINYGEIVVGRRTIPNWKKCLRTKARPSRRKRRCNDFSTTK